MNVRFAAVALLLTACAAPLVAQARSPLDFAKGPAQWIMLPEEQKAWRAVKSEAQARDFIDLFWARRDPTPGTPVNEFRTDFDSRVTFADQYFTERNRRGALSDRGQVLITLGFPANMAAEMEKGAGMSGNDLMATSVAADSKTGNPTGPSESATGNRTLAAKDTWTYTHEQSQKFGMPRLEVVFYHDEVGRVRRSPQETDFSHARVPAMKSYVVNADLKEAPEWSRIRTDRAAEVEPREIEVETASGKIVKKTILDVPPPVARPFSVGKLTLVRDINSLQPQGASDPFLGINAVSSFTRAQELGWTAEYCSGSITPEAPAVEVRLRITGTAGGQPVSMTSEPEEFVPDSIKASPGCYLLRGSLPLADFEAGNYQLKVTLTGTGATEGHDLTRDFVVE